jgi:hypothetical protein
MANMIKRDQQKNMLDIFFGEGGDGILHFNDSKRAIVFPEKDHN